MNSLLDIAESLIDDRVGIIQSVQESRQEPGSTEFIHFCAKTCRIQTDGRIDQNLWGFGVSPYRKRAMMKAIGEAVERYCAATFFSDDFPVSSFEAASFPCIQPDQFALYNEEQHRHASFPFARFTNVLPVRWVPALDLNSSRTQYVPATMVFLPYVGAKNLGEQPIAPQISTGLACHTNSTLAGIAGICEVIERDAVAMVWQAKLSMPRVRLESLSAENRDLLARLKSPGASIILLHLRMDHDVPIIMATMRRRCAEAPALIISAAAHTDPERAIQKSLEELAQIDDLARQLKAERPNFRPGRKWQFVLDPASHAAVYLSHANARRANFLFSSPVEIDFKEIKDLSTGHASDDLPQLAAIVKALGHSVLLVDVTSEDVRSLGLSVVRAIIPGFHPLFMGHSFRALGGTRLWTVPQRLGHIGIAKAWGDNPMPHPFS